MIKSDILYDEFDGSVELWEITQYYQGVQTIHKSQREAEITTHINWLSKWTFDESDL